MGSERARLALVVCNSFDECIHRDGTGKLSIKAGQCGDCNDAVRAVLEAMKTVSVETEVAGTEAWLVVAAMEDRAAVIWTAMLDSILTGEG